MPTENEIQLAKAVHALTESVAASFTMQAALCRVLVDVHPNHAAKFQALADGADTCASNLVRHLPPLPAD